LPKEEDHLGRDVFLEKKKKPQGGCSQKGKGGDLKGGGELLILKKRGVPNDREWGGRREIHQARGKGV